MAVTAHVYPSLDLNIAKKVCNLSTDALFVLLIASGGNAYTWNSTAQSATTVGGAAGTGVLGGSGAGSLTEVSTSGTGYTRQALTSVTVTNSALVTTLAVAANPAWATSTISAVYALFYTAGAGGSGASTNDATSNLPICYWDFGGTQASSNGTFTLQINASGLVTFTAS